MIESIFYSLLITSFLVGGTVYLNESHKEFHPLGFMMDRTGYSSVESNNHQKMQQEHQAESNVLMQSHIKIENLDLEEKNFFNRTRDQQMFRYSQRYTVLREQGNRFISQVTELNQEVRALNDKMRKRLDQLSNNPLHDSAYQQQKLIENKQKMQDKVREEMTKMADIEERNRDFIYVSQQHAHDLIEKERQNAEEQELMLKQKIADQMQLLHDHQDLNPPNLSL